MSQRAKDQSAPSLPPEARSGQEAQNATPETKVRAKNTPDAGDGRRVSAQESRVGKKPRHHKADGEENTQPRPDIAGSGKKP